MRGGRTRRAPGSSASNRARSAWKWAFSGRGHRVGKANKITQFAQASLRAAFPHVKKGSREQSAVGPRSSPLQSPAPTLRRLEARDDPQRVLALDRHQICAGEDGAEARHVLEPGPVRIVGPINDLRD